MSGAIGDFPFERAPAPNLLALLRKDVDCVFARGAAARTIWAVLTTYLGRHPIPDPVGKAIGRLLRRIQALEARVAAAGAAPQACARGGGEGRCECAAGLGDSGPP
jgi:hypothetical protein